MITYKELYDWFRKEKYSETLQALPENWLEEVSAYLKEKERLAKKQGAFSETVRLTQKQFENACSMVKELLMLRKRKVLNLAFASANTGINPREVKSLLEAEQQLFEDVCKALKECDAKIFDHLWKKETKESNNVLVRFIEHVPAFLDQKGQQLGPFEVGDVANLPREIVKILIEDNKAVKIKEEQTL